MQRALAALNDANASGALDTMLARGWKPLDAAGAPPRAQSTSLVAANTTANTSTLAPQSRKSKRKQRREQKEVARVVRSASAMRAVDRLQMVTAAKASLGREPSSLHRVQQSPLLDSAYAGVEALCKTRHLLASRGSL